MATLSEIRAQKDTDAERSAFWRARKREERRERVAQWLRDNPDIGALNGGKYYRVINGRAVSVMELDGEQI